MAGPLKVLVLAHNLADAAVGRRISMLCEGGALVTVAGFRRTPEPITHVMGCKAVDFGRTYDYGFLQRIVSVLREVVFLKRHRTLFAEADIILARNLEMLAIGVRGRSFCRPKPVLIYECLDIHRLLLGEGPVGMGLRLLEGWLSRRAAALFTSSQAFVSRYFEPHSYVRLPVRLIENKMATASAITPFSPRQPGPPWTIGWFGVIRCKKSLQVLSDLVRHSEGAIEVVIRGRPDFVQFENFEKSTTELPGLRFLGPYKSPDDLASIYGNIHFTWAIDMFEEGLNSSWLLPNRLYGGAFASVPIALENVETGRFLKSLGLGVTMKEPLRSSLTMFFKNLTPAIYRTLEDAVLNTPRSTWMYDRNDCKALVDYMCSLNGDVHG